jgi:hypothetical protein
MLVNPTSVGSITTTVGLVAVPSAMTPLGSPENEPSRTQRQAAPPAVRHWPDRTSVLTAKVPVLSGSIVEDRRLVASGCQRAHSSDRKAVSLLAIWTIVGPSGSPLAMISFGVPPRPLSRAQ